MDAFGRERLLKDFRRGEARMLITTDLPLHKIQVAQISLSILYDLPNREKYLRYVGTSGRFGRRGVAICFVTLLELQVVEEIKGAPSFSPRRLLTNIALRVLSDGYP